MACLVDEIPDFCSNPASAVSQPVLVLPHSPNSLPVRTHSLFPLQFVLISSPPHSAISDIKTTDERSDDEDDGEPDEADDKEKED